MIGARASGRHRDNQSAMVSKFIVRSEDQERRYVNRRLSTDQSTRCVINSAKSISTHFADVNTIMLILSDYET